MSSTTPPGWYDDHTSPGVQRYWDGTRWTDHARHAPPPPAGQLPFPPRDELDSRGHTPARRRSRGKTLLLVAAAGVGVMAVAAVASTTTGGGETPTAQITPAAGGATAPPDATAGKAATKAGGKKEARTQLPGIGDTVRDGKFAFTVTKVERGRKKIGDQYLGTTAQGVFLLVRVKVKNIGDEPQTFLGENQKVYDAKGREFSADTEAAIYLGEESQSLWEEINPGNTVKGTIVFDIPKKVKPVTIELHDSMFSGGAKVRL